MRVATKNEWYLHDPIVLFLYYDVGIGFTDDAYKYVWLYLYYFCMYFLHSLHAGLVMSH